MMKLTSYCELIEIDDYVEFAYERMIIDEMD